MRLAILGAGSVQCSPAVIAALANYFGERPMEICLFDADEERLELFSRYARVCCTVTHSQHAVFATIDLDEALLGVDLVIVQVDENCARKYLANRLDILREGTDERVDDAQPVTTAAKHMVPEGLPAQGRVLSLIETETRNALPMCHSISGWPSPVPAGELYKIPHQVLRWVRGEEFLGEWLAAHERTPLRAWLDRAIAELAPR